MSNTVSLALGTFDGLHLGHMAVLDGALSAPADIKLAVTFSRPPKSYFSSEVFPLMSEKEKNERLEALGFCVVSLDFARVREQSPEEFLCGLFDEYDIKYVSCGFNYRFGRNGAGDVGMLEDYSAKRGARCRVSLPVMNGGEPISSSRIRQALGSGDIVSANAMLGRSYSLTATVVHGDARGRTIGFPTVNQTPDGELAPVRNGVYRSVTEIDGKKYGSVTNIGIRPSFCTEHIGWETHIFTYSGDAYGKTVTVYLKEFIRPEQKFGSLDELKAAIEKDKEICESR